jgi:hypothetical protein
MLLISRVRVDNANDMHDAWLSLLTIIQCVCTYVYLGVISFCNAKSNMPFYKCNQDGRNKA